METLAWLESIRNPVLNKISMLFTSMASEVILIVILCLLYWCISKKAAYRLGFVYFISGIFVQVLKVVFQIPRPWLRSETLTPVQSALKGATGYSFPSGHTQNATALYGSAAWFSKKKWFQILMIIIILAVAFSRMYLGVHTPLDVSAGFIITVIVIIGFNYIIDKNIIYKFKQSTVFAALLILTVLMLIYGAYLVCTNSVDLDNAADYFKSTGAAFGFITGWYMETNMLDFDERKGGLPAQIIKYIVGLAVVLALKSGLKIIIGTSLQADIVRYAIITYWIIFLYPLIFTKVQKINIIKRK